MTRSRRRILAWLGILGIAFAQLAVTAHACALRVKIMESHSSSAMAAAHAGHCGGQHADGLPQAPQGNACEVQCTEGAPSGDVPPLPPVAFATIDVVAVPAVVSAGAREWGRSMLAANSAAPPLSLQFCRFLI